MLFPTGGGELRRHLTYLGEVLEEQEVGGKPGFGLAEQVPELNRTQ